MNSTMHSAMDSTRDSGRDSIRNSAADAPAQDFNAQPEPLWNKIDEEAYANALSDPDDIPPLTKRQIRNCVPLRIMPGETKMERLRYAKALCQARAKWLKRKQARRSEAHPSQEAMTGEARCQSLRQPAAGAPRLTSCTGSPCRDRTASAGTSPPPLLADVAALPNGSGPQDFPEPRD
ncbi:MAG: hypothetical protein II515_07725 [Desulfovibrio sp.]|nr:hypothetical protein [Desulfovibrio sp.]